jgi:hypothetical protein
MFLPGVPPHIGQSANVLAEKIAPTVAVIKRMFNPSLLEKIELIVVP